MNTLTGVAAAVSDVNDRQQRRGRLIFIVLGLLFIAPLAAAWFWLANVDKLRPEVTVNNGNLIVPAVALDVSGLPLAEGGGSLDADYFQHRWTLVYIHSGTCDTACEQLLYVTRQVEAALGRDMNRVQRLYLMLDEPRDMMFLRQQHPRLTLARADNPAGRSFIGQFETAAGPVGGRLYLVDPLGNLMMWYPAEVSARDLDEDLERLLKYSHIG